MNSKISTLQRIADICILFVMLERFCMGESLLRCWVFIPWVLCMGIVMEILVA